jgi:hypothetical protein
MSEADDILYARHSRWSDPGRFASNITTLAPDSTKLPEIVGGLLLHPLFAADGRESGEPQLRYVSEIIEAVLGKDGRPLHNKREPDRRVLGTCRNYALLACTILRQHQRPARLRVGFADYFTPDFWEDHWVCEYRDGTVWHLLDAELTSDVCRRFGIGFDPADVPRARFLGAGPAWLALRRGDYNPAQFGVSAIGISGMKFAASTLLRDVAALNKQETMPWDYWGPTRDFRPGANISTDWLCRFDELAASLVALDQIKSFSAPDILDAYAWAAPQASVLSFPAGKPVEVAIL